MDNLEVSNAMLAHTRFSHILHGPFSWSEIEWDNDGNRRSPKEVTYLKAYIIYLIEHEKELNWDSMKNIRDSLLKGFPTMPAEHWKTLYNYLVGSHRDSLSDILELKYDLHTWRPNRAQRRYRKRHKEYARRKFDRKFYKTMRGLKRALDKQKEQPFPPPVPDGQFVMVDESPLKSAGLKGLTVEPLPKKLYELKAITFDNDTIPGMGNNLK